MKTFAIALAALALATPAYAAAQMTAGDLYRLCPSADKGEQTACRFFVFGVAEGFGMADASTMAPDGKLIEKPKSVFCFPGAGLTTAHMASAVLATMEIEFAAFPADRDLAATGVVVAAFRQKFPCRR